MELDGEGAANFEQLKDLICKECDKRDCHYAHVEDKYKKLEHQVTTKTSKKTWQRGADNQQAMDQVPQRKKSDQRQVMNQCSNRPRSVPPNNTGQTNRRRSENHRRAIKNNSGKRSKNKNKPPSPLHNKLDQNQSNAPGRKKLPRKQQQKN